MMVGDQIDIQLEHRRRHKLSPRGRRPLLARPALLGKTARAVVFQANAADRDLGLD